MMGLPTLTGDSLDESQAAWMAFGYRVGTDVPALARVHNMVEQDRVAAASVERNDLQ